MKRINTSSAVDIGGGKSGFTNGDPGSGTPATDLSADWCNNIQEEIAGVVEAAGITLDANDYTQLYAALQSLYGGGSDIPVGSVSAYAANTPPSDWLECDGSAISRTVYSDLFSTIGTTYGAGDGTTTFNLPDLRGEFLRGWDHGRGVDSGRALGSYQGDMLKSHSHTAGYYNVSNVSYNNFFKNTTYLSPSYDASNTPVSMAASGGGSETRPRNVAVMFIIKY